MIKVFVLLGVGVMLPVLLSSAVGIVSLALGDTSNPLVVGVLGISFAAAALGGAVTVTVLLGNRARRARLRDDLTANVSHELRTPLSTIRMYAQTLLAGTLEDDPERSRESLEIIVRESQWLEAMIDRLLTWRSTEKDRAALGQELDTVQAAVEEAAERFTRMVQPKDTHFATQLQTEALVLHEPKMLITAVLNLLINAYKYSPAPRHILLRVEDEKNTVCISVHDKGPGVPRGLRKKIFEPFFQAEKDGQRHKGGMGLGLAIVRHLAKSHKGSITVEDEPSGGANFILRLPSQKTESTNS